MHADFDQHRKLRVDRRLNVLLYLNEDWDDAYGGHLELWDPTMTRRVKRVAPIANRLVIFRTSDTSFHGHPDALTVPEGPVPPLARLVLLHRALHGPGRAQHGLGRG